MFLKKLFGTSSQRYIKKLMPVVDQINDIFQTLESKSDQDLTNRTMELKKMVEKAIQKFQQLAKDAQSSGDPVLVENYLQHADHYSRRLNELNEKNKIDSTRENNVENKKNTELKNI